MEEIEDIGGGKSERLGSWMHGATSASTSNPKDLLRGKPGQREDRQPVLGDCGRVSMIYTVAVP